MIDSLTTIENGVAAATCDGRRATSGREVAATTCDERRATSGREAAAATCDERRATSGREVAATTFDERRATSGREAAAARVIGPFGGYRKMLSFGMTCLVYHATTTFCKRNYSYKNDPLGKTTGQMVGAARSARQNIVEGSARAGTSKETELRLLDVAKGSLEELAGDFEAFLSDQLESPWSERDPRTAKVKAIEFDRFTKTDDARHEFGVHLLDMRKRFAPEIENEDSVHAANAILVVIDRANSLLARQIAKTAEDFLGQGGFTERLSKARLEERDREIAAEDAPKCPKCGGPMRKSVARKGANAGNPFWSCRAYPNCDGTRRWQWH